MKVILTLCTWSLLLFTLCSIWQTVRAGIRHLKKLHQIPCANCEYFTNDYRLKCTVDPIKACTEDAICCADFTAKTAVCNASQTGRRKGKK